MNDIGKRDIETYLRNLISESLGSQNEDLHGSLDMLFPVTDTQDNFENEPKKSQK